MNWEETVLTVELGKRSYPILIGWDILKNIGQYLHQFPVNKKVLLISNPTVYSLFGQEVTTALAGQGYTVHNYLVPDGEEAKSLEQAAKIYRESCAARLDRKSIVLALGGGVVGDLAGFIAATYMRGINFVQVPTTLLAQVDSSVGGKVGINLSEGKNLVGAFYQPRLVYMDLKTLTSLPIRELRTGLAEIIKYGVIDGEDFFTYLEQNVGKLLVFDREVLMHTVKKSCQIKSNIVSRDELEEGLRAILNFGHTIGHAIEALSGYRRYRHGEAIAIGMRYAGLIAGKINWWSWQEQRRLENILKLAGLPMELPDFNGDELLAAMELDKKNTGGDLTMVLPKQIGLVKIMSGINPELVKKVLPELPENV